MGGRSRGRDAPGAANREGGKVGAVRQPSTWVTVDELSVVAFIVVEARYPQAAEITSAAVRPERQGSGTGTALVDAALAQLPRRPVLVEVKTLDASAGYAPYVATRAYGERCGFRPVDCIDPVPGWQPGNPSAIYLAAPAATRG